MTLEHRKWFFIGLFLTTGFVFLVRLFFVQVISKEYSKAATANARQRIVIHPHRGLIYDRNGKLLVYNAPVYDVMMIYKKVKIKDTLSFCNFFETTKEQLNKTLSAAKLHSPQRPWPFLKQVAQEDFARIQDKLTDYPGFFAVSRTVRSYPTQSLAHVLGYIREISGGKLKNDKSGYYAMGDYVGVSGLEAAYETELRGRKGVKHILTDVKGREKGSFSNGQFDTLSKAGKNLISTIDLELQQYGEKLMQNKSGSIVAIEPSTGEVLAMVSATGYDPNLLTGRSFTRNYELLSKNPNKPLFNRAINAKYPPGSTFKVVQALVALQENLINEHSVFPCNQMLVKCHPHMTADFHRSIQYSCNPYYFSVFRRIIYQNKILRSDSILQVAKDGDGNIGYEKWRNYMMHFGLGKKTGVDLVYELDGNIPEISLYNRRYGVGQWKFSNVYSLGIGQGEIGVTPLQLANIAAIIANRGYFITPHLVKSIGDKKEIREEFTQKQTVPIDKKYFDMLIPAMQDAYRAGTVVPQFTIPSLQICGKTGTAQNPQGKDHSVFIAFAPKDNPKIAIAVYVENAGFGGEFAAPLASLMMEKYLKREITAKWLEKNVIEKSLLLPWIPEDENDSNENLPVRKVNQLFIENRRSSLVKQ